VYHTESIYAQLVLMHICEGSKHSTFSILAYMIVGIYILNDDVKRDPSLQRTSKERSSRYFSCAYLAMRRPYHHHLHTSSFTFPHIP
jgi:hypothetical protein